MVSLFRIVIINRDDHEFDIVELYNRVMHNKHVQLILYPYRDESEGYQIFYKIYASMTCYIILLVLYLLMKYQ